MIRVLESKKHRLMSQLLDFDSYSGRYILFCVRQVSGVKNTHKISRGIVLILYILGVFYFRTCLFMLCWSYAELSASWVEKSQCRELTINYVVGKSFKLNSFLI